MNRASLTIRNIGIVVYRLMIKVMQNICVIGSGSLSKSLMKKSRRQMRSASNNG